LGEFNFNSDPEAAKLVLDQFPTKCTSSLITWESTVMNTLPSSIISEETKNKSKLGFLLYMIKQHSVKAFGDEDAMSFSQYHHLFQNTGLVLCDLLAAIYFLYPEVVTKSESFPCTVELGGRYTRSMVIVDRLKSLLPNNKPITLPIHFDIEAISELEEMKFY